MAVYIIWSFQVVASKQKTFEAVYGSKGAWAQLFRNSPFYKGTTLLKQLDSPLVYWTLDHWYDLKSFEEFYSSYISAYNELDQKCAGLHLCEKKIGVFEIYL